MTTRKQIIDAIADQTNFEIEEIVKGSMIANCQRWTFHIKNQPVPIDLFVPRDSSLSVFDVDVWVDSICDAFNELNALEPNTTPQSAQE